MAFLSSQNLLAPFRNKVHITTIILAALVLIMFRASGGSVSTSPQQTPVAKKNSALDIELPRANAFEHKGRIAKDDDEDIESSFFFKEARKDQATPKAPVKKPIQNRQKTQKGSGSSNIDDIYNSLNF